MRKRWSMPAALLMVLGACAPADDAPGPGPPAPDPRLRGRIVAESGQGTTVVFQSLPDGDPVEVDLPESTEHAPVGRPVEGGLVTLAFERGGGVLYRVEVGGEVEALIPRIGDAVGLSVRRARRA